MPTNPPRKELTPEQDAKLREWAHQRLREGKAPLTPQGREAMLRKRPPANKLPA
ncbi:hypothetical protein [Dokdonella sp.]|uniref:hypothetical protein n=1 Tax=Dokdonella sp. TaxID=2291710 RepID=UPI003784B964